MLAFLKNQFSNFFEQGIGWVPEVSLQFFLALVVGQLRKLRARKLQELADLVINIRSAGSRRQFLASQQLRDVGLRYLGGGGQVSLFQPQFFQPLFDH